MTNHVHLVLRTSEPNLSRGMHWLNGRYAGWFNRAHQRSGHLFQGRFHSFLIGEEAYLAQVIRYVVLNPVRASMVARPEEYRWSSYRPTGGFEAAPAWLDVAAVLAVFERQSASSEAAFREFVLAKVDSPERLWDKAINGIYLGTETWAKKMRKRVESKPRSTDHPATQRAVGRPKMADIVAAVARAGGRRSSSMDAARRGRLGTALLLDKITVRTYEYLESKRVLHSCSSNAGGTRNEEGLYTRADGRPVLSRPDAGCDRIL